MCGLAGFLIDPTAARPEAERRGILAAMGRQLARRGPDDEQTYDDGVLSLVFRRLSIVDVTGGRQPIWNERGSAFVCLNGEIWNHAALRAELAGTHTFSSRSDAEVVVHLFEDHGPRLLDRLDGMFALAVWDRAARRLLLARDRFGIKPLYYAWVPGGLLFGSELKALLVHPDCPSRVRFGDLDLGYLRSEVYSSVETARIPTFVEGVEALPGGAYLVARPDDGRGGGARPVSYWSLAPAIARGAAAPARSAASHVEEIEARLVSAVRSHLMSDVPVGAFLSGGFDSSALCAIAARQGRALPCFTIVERTTVAAGDVERARRLTAALELPFHPVAFEAESFADHLGFTLETLEYFVWMMDAPRFAPELLFKHELHRYAKTVRPDLKVMLLGQGADEFAGGYSAPLGAATADWGAYAEGRLKPQLDALDLDDRGFPAALRPLLRAGALAGPGGAAAPFHREMERRIIALQSFNLWNEDRVSASQGVEARVPYLDHHLVEALAAVPAALHPELFWDKAILRAAAAPFLPEDVRRAPKVPLWLGGDTGSVHRLMIGCARGAFPAFRDAYLARSDSLFSPLALAGLFAQTNSARDPARAAQAAKLLLAAMTTAIFARLCRELRTESMRIVPLGPPSSLPAAAPPWLDARPVDTAP